MWVNVLCWIDRVWYVKECVCCACDPSVYLDVPSMGCLAEVNSSFKSLRAGSQVFALLLLFLRVILHTMWSGKSLQLLCILPFDILCLSAIICFVVVVVCPLQPSSSANPGFPGPENSVPVSS